MNPLQFTQLQHSMHSSIFTEIQRMQHQQSTAELETLAFTGLAEVTKETAALFQSATTRSHSTCASSQGCRKKLCRQCREKWLLAAPAPSLEGQDRMRSRE